MKALLIGGSNGIGLAVAEGLHRLGWQITILDMQKPAEGTYDHFFFDLRYPDMDLLADLKNSHDLLFISAGIGYVGSFKDMHPGQVRKIMEVDAANTIAVLKAFYDRIAGDRPYYCGVMTSIAGMLSSPLCAVYGAAKAALCRFIESVNIELEMEGSVNRILNVAPAAFKGSRFEGGENDLELLRPLAAQIIERMFRSDTVYIPEYENRFRDILKQQHEDPHAYGLHSYEYKKASGRTGRIKPVIGYLSGTFDLFHVGHVNIFKRAKQQCDYLIVGVHRSGDWKGKETFIPFEERMQMVASCRYVDEVVACPDEDDDAYALYHFDRLFVGSDYQGSERFRRYEEFFKDKDVKIVYFPYTECTSSTKIRNKIIERTLHER